MTIPIDQLTTNALAAKIDGAALRKMDAKGVRALLGKVDAKIVFDPHCVRNQAAARLESAEAEAADVVREEVLDLLKAGATKTEKDGAITLTSKTEVKR